MASPNQMGELCVISECLYEVLSNAIGTECLVKLRRQKYDLFNVFSNFDTDRSYGLFNSGSRREGFDVNSSDYDIMEIDRRVLVLDEYSHQRLTTLDFPCILITDTEGTSPGFTLLKCVKYHYSVDDINSSLISRGDNVFVSSRALIEDVFSLSSTTIHGPCRSGSLFELEYDLAYTLRCPYWPKQALSFIHRSLRSSWPPLHVMKSICEDGYLIVPINSKHQTSYDQIDLEWRMSFSLAEKKLIYSFNHCQFVCYGLLKLFLNEVLKKDSETGELLCSYFMKTAVFWEISERRNTWCMENFLFRVWNAFRRVLKWVSLGYCPNYFIPEHNMFHGKIYGRQQRNLMLKLNSLYSEGYNCIIYRIPLNTPTLSYVSERVSVRDTDNICSLIATECEKIRFILIALSAYIPESSNAVVKALYQTASLEPISEEMTSAIKLRINTLLQRIAFKEYSGVHLSETNINRYLSNKYDYRFKANALHILRRTTSSLYMNKIYYAICSYQAGDYYKTIRIVYDIKERLQTRLYMHDLNLNGIVILVMRNQGMTCEEIMKKNIISNVRFLPWFHIEELNIESRAVVAVGGASLYIPPLVFVDFLLFLSLSKVNEVNRRLEVLIEIQQLCHDDGYHVTSICKAITWQILGISQQLCGDYHGALRSYANALNDKHNNFKLATLLHVNCCIIERSSH